LKGAKGLLVNITGGKDITLFEVEESVNKIRAEVDPEAELIFGAIKDDNLSGKIRVSIVATSLDGQAPENKTILNMVDRIQNRNNGYSDSLFSKNVSLENNTFNSINGSTALKIDEQFDIETENNGLIKSDIDPVTEPNYKSEHALEIEKNEDMISGVSFDSASYIENNTQIENSVNEETIQSSESIAEEYTPQLFSEESSTDQNIETTKIDDNEESQQEDKLFDQTIGDEEDFEIPAFLRRQKF
jgi:cell division protein FtsZ